jgi:hypothetical protein
LLSGSFGPCRPRRGPLLDGEPAHNARVPGSTNTRQVGSRDRSSSRVKLSGPVRFVACWASRFATAAATSQTLRLSRLTVLSGERTEALSNLLQRRATERTLVPLCTLEISPGTASLPPS